MSGLAHRILIVDDEQEVCELLSALVKREGFEALAATDGETALRLVLSEPPDVVVMDFKMPVISTRSCAISLSHSPRTVMHPAPTVRTVEMCARDDGNASDALSVLASGRRFQGRSDPPPRAV